MKTRWFITLFAFVAGALVVSCSKPQQPVSPSAPATPARVESSIVRGSDAKEYPIPGGTCRLYEDCPTGRLSCAVIEQDGRYPEQGFRVNATCTEAVYVIDGDFEVTLGNSYATLGAGDVAYIVPGTRYAIDGKGKAFVFIEPRWDKAQNTQAPAP